MKKILSTIRIAFEQDKIIPFLFNLLFFSLPLIFLPWTSELFEFNKIVFVYIFTTLILFSWFTKIIVSQKIIFKRSILDIPLLLFLISQILASVFSIDKYTSIFGYYSRFNGGLLSTASYILLYWAYVSNMTSINTKKLFKAILVSGAIVSLWGIMEHFGLSLSCVMLRNEWNADCWVQDVQARVFATMGQPNWLAAYLVAISPLTWAMALNEKTKNKNLTLKNYWIYHLLNILFFVTILFTKSRSGILAYLISFFVFWDLSLWHYRIETDAITLNIRYFFVSRWKALFILQSKAKSSYLTTLTYTLIILSFIGTPWTPNLAQVINPTEVTEAQIVSQVGTVIELDGTESGALRQIVWQGALDIWKAYPILGTGVETFAYSYYQFRPLAHNLTSEWDFLYNKAHNEFLNTAANSGSLGLLTYLLLIAVIVVWFILKSERNIYKTALLAGVVSLCVTNFFGFSVVVTSLQLFIFPAMALSLLITNKNVDLKWVINNKQKKQFLALILVSAIALLLIGRYWYGDVLYSNSKKLSSTGQLQLSVEASKKAVSLSSSTAVYLDQLAHSLAQLAILEEDEKNALSFADLAKKASDKALDLSPRNVNLIKSRSNIFVDLAQVEPEYLLESMTTLQKLLVYAPTDPAVYQMMGLSFASAGYPDQAANFIGQAIALKPDYKRARLTLNYVYQRQGKFSEAREQLQYILDNISPDDTSIKQELEDLSSLEEEK